MNIINGCFIETISDVKLYYKVVDQYNLDECVCVIVCLNRKRKYANIKLQNGISTNIVNFLKETNLEDFEKMFIECMQYISINANILRE